MIEQPLLIFTDGKEVIGLGSLLGRFHVLRAAVLIVQVGDFLELFTADTIETGIFFFDDQVLVPQTGEDLLHGIFMILLRGAYPEVETHVQAFEQFPETGGLPGQVSICLQAAVAGGFLVFSDRVRRCRW